MPFAVDPQADRSRPGQDARESSSKAHRPQACTRRRRSARCHRAVLQDGREVVIKVQYPGVAESCDTDLGQLKLALLHGAHSQGRQGRARRSLRGDPLERLQRGASTTSRRPRNIALFRQFFVRRSAHRHPGDGARAVLAARADDDPGARRSSRDGGRALRRWLAQPDRDAAVRLHVPLGVRAESRARRSATGQLPGAPRGSLVDLRLRPHQAARAGRRRRRSATVRAALAKDWRAVDRGLVRLGVRVPGSRPVPDEFYESWDRIVMRPFRGDAPFDFASSTMHVDAMARATRRSSIWTSSGRR